MSTTGVLTEREWRKRSARARRAHPRCWGAQCMLPQARKSSLKEDRAFRAFLILLSMMTALMLPMAVPRRHTPAEYPVLPASAGAEHAPEVRAVSAIGYALPDGLSYQAHTYTREELARGKLLLIDGNHPLPSGVPAPNTLSIATYGKGMVPVNDLSIKSGRETIEALSRMFTGMRARGVGGLTVWRATLSPAEQRELRLDMLRAYAARMPIQEAVARTLDETDEPYTGELQQEYTVEIRLNQSGSNEPDERPLGQSEPGRYLLQNAWRYGFIQRNPDGAGALGYRFRFVGEAHATAMTFLDLELESYLELLHQRRVITVKKDGALRYLILCKPLEDTHIGFSLPEGAVYEASLDNMGYAVVACTLPD